jgi:hypothetical protein
MPLDIIDVVLPRFTDSTFDTPEKALAGGEAITRERVISDVSSCFDSVICSAIWSDTVLQMRLDSGRTLSFRCAQNHVDIALDDPPADIAPNLPEKLLLRLAGQTWEWERGGLISAIVGRTLRLIQATESTFFLYVSGIRILWIHVLIDGRTSTPFLCWSQTD